MEHHRISKQNVSRETFSYADHVLEVFHNELETYLETLFWWNKRINLVSRDVPRETIREHLRHSLLLSHFKAFQSSECIVDAGTGGGLPGIPLAVSHPRKKVFLNDIVTKKCLALKQMVRKMELKNTRVIEGSIARLRQQTPFLLISKHAFKIDELYEMTSHLPWDFMVLFKGIDFEKEIETIASPLSIEAYDLSAESDFYRGKALVFVRRS